MRAPNRDRLRFVTLSLALAAGGGSLAGCHKPAAEQAAQPSQPEQAAQPAPPPKEPEVVMPDPPATPEGLKKAYADLTKQYADMQQSFADLSKDVEAIPTDLQGFPQLRANFYAVEESRGVAAARVTMLGSRLDAALRSGKKEDLQQVATGIGKASNDGRKLGEMYIKLLHGTMAYQRVVDHHKEAVAASSAPATPAKGKHPKPKN